MRIKIIRLINSIETSSIQFIGTMALNSNCGRLGLHCTPLYSVKTHFMMWRRRYEQSCMHPFLFQKVCLRNEESYYITSKLQKCRTFSSVMTYHSGIPCLKKYSQSEAWKAVKYSAVFWVVCDPPFLSLLVSDYWNGTKTVCIIPV